MSTLDMLTYNGIDSAVTFECAEAFFSEINKSPEHKETYDMTIALLQPLMYFMSRGLRVDEKNLEIEQIRVAKEIVEKQAELDALCGEPLNPNSPKQCQQYFYGKLGITPYTTIKKDAYGNKKRGITTDDKAMQRMAKGTTNRKPIKEASLVQHIRKLIKLKGTYLDITLDRDKRLRCSFNPRGTRFGRLSSSKTVFDTGMNLQNLPETFKRFIIADEGKILWEMDKAQAEWVATAFISRDANMIKVCEEGSDPHAYTASQMYNVTEDLVKKESKLLGHIGDIDEIAEVRGSMTEGGLMVDVEGKPLDLTTLPRTMSMRQAGKKSNHGLNYKETYKGFALHNEIMEKDAKVIVNKYHSIYPGLKQFYSWVETKLAEDRTLVNCFNRSYKFLNQWNEDLFKAAVSYLPQSTISDLVNRAIIKIYNDNDFCMKNIEMLTQVHDSILGQFDTPEDYINFFIIARAMLKCRDHLNPTMEYHGKEFTIGTDLKIGTCWGHMVEVELPEGSKTEDAHKLAKRIQEALETLQKEL